VEEVEKVEEVGEVEGVEEVQEVEDVEEVEEQGKEEQGKEEEQVEKKKEEGSKEEGEDGMSEVGEFGAWLKAVSCCLKGNPNMTAAKRRKEEGFEAAEEEEEIETEEERSMRVVKSVLDEVTVLRMVTDYLELTKDASVPEWARVTFKQCQFDPGSGDAGTSALRRTGPSSSQVLRWRCWFLEVVTALHPGAASYYAQINSCDCQPGRCTDPLQ
jgi:hypothetical protein